MSDKKQIKRNSAVAFLGSESAALAFRAFGFDTFGVRDAQAAREIWGDIATAGYSTIFVSEELASEMKGLLEPYYLQPLPAVMFLPEKLPGTGLAAERIRRATIKAVGAEI